MLVFRAIRIAFKSMAVSIMLVSAELAADSGIQFGGHPERPGFGPEELAVIVNDADPVSIKIAEYYVSRRRIPKTNVIHVNFRPGRTSLMRAEFQKIKNVVDAITPRHVQAYALAWTIPYRVECMSITTAFAADFDEDFCSKTCGSTKQSPYFNSSSRRPYDDYHIRPTMALAGGSFIEVKRLIDRGVASDHTFPAGTGYLVSTSDKARNVRAVNYPEIIQRYLNSSLDMRLVREDYIKNRSRVLFYFTGIKYVKALKTNHFVPGAIADHLTSAGGDLTSSGDQMSSLRWLEAGVTGSYGAVVEPCNFLTKFPQPGVVINRYLQGETLIESYWKSVAWPGEGIFIGEPLAAPFSL
jgi:uncharacterized protein (TIGR03790 family)